MPRPPIQTDAAPRPSDAPPSTRSEGLRHLSYAIRPERLRPGNAIELLRSGGEAYPAMLGAIAAARRSVCLEMYIIRADDSGMRFSEALRERARAGVAVRLIYDAIGCISLPGSYIRELEKEGVEVIEFHPVKPWKQRFGLNQRDHRKILVVDEEVGFLGGLNIGNEYLPVSQGGRGWHDIFCELRGPIVRDLAYLFRRVWMHEGGEFFSLSLPDVQTSSGSCLARVVDNRKIRQRRQIRRAYVHAINRASDHIFISNAYFLPDHGIRRALRRAVKRGVKVRLMVPDNSDVTLVQYAGQYIYGPLLGAGIEILTWPETMMHAKTAVIDSMWSSIGSYNLDSRSLFYNLEVMVEVVDRDFGATMIAQFEADAARCAPLTLEAWESRPAWQKFLSWFFYLFRRWL
jgi:cardiolipin synthase A/B